MDHDVSERAFSFTQIEIETGREDECEVEEKSGRIGFGNSKANARARLLVSKMKHDWLSPISYCLLVLSGQT